MTRSHAHRLVAMWRAGMFSLAAAMVQGCGTADCAETATCPDPDDAAAQATDEGADEPSADSSVGAGGGSADAESTLDATADASGDDGIGTDASQGSDGLADSEAEPGSADGNPATDASGSPGAKDAAADVARGCTPVGPETCNNGIDDDCNGLIDCADRGACPAYACAGRVPAGWVGPALLWTGPFPAPQVPSCPTGYQPIDAQEGLTFPNDQCTCTCSPSGQQCSPTAVGYIDQACATSCVTVKPPGTGACMPLPSNVCGSNGSLAVTGSPSPGGTCAPQVTTTDGGAPTWANTVRLCTWVGAPDSPGGCPVSGAQCLSAPFGLLCIYHSGAVSSCPAGYTAGAPIIVYTGALDQRSCGPCSCSGPAGGGCSGNVRFYAGGACGGTGTQNAPACTTYSLSPSPGSVRATYALTPGTCSVSNQPMPAGAVVPTGPTTVCCQ